MRTSQRSNTVVLMGCGDVGTEIEPVEAFIEPALPILQEADLRFAQCDRSYSQRGSWQVPSRVPSHGGSAVDTRLHPRKASVFRAGGFDMVSLASNHTMDWGDEALLDTIDVLRGMGIQVCGVGKNIEEARQPAIFQHNGVKVAFLAYCSVLPRGYAAGPSRPGVAPMEAHTYYEPEEYQAGTPPRVITIPYSDQLSALQEDIARAKEQADAVVMSIHWGVHHIPKVIAMYQPQVAHAAIDAGADLILGHHAHILKAVEVYKGKVCFYSLGNFIAKMEEAPEFYKQPDYNYSRPPSMTMLAKAVLSRRGVEQVSFLPGYINEELQPEILNREDARFDEVVNYMEWVSDEFSHSFQVQGNEVVIEATR